ncbi:hypothetical protein DPMN_071944 [Dreissena polymorpha]|uniref:Uncharacterized protein n=1 Tax=Dreissena polymorpha TaxID=45954 RepID=A0A9D3Z7N5_DREPO|nr:hypothetical protein DPMN_071944 [Dreissena polymorpha]
MYKVYFISELLQIVVKPSGPDYYASFGVTFHAPGNVESVIDAVNNLLDVIHDGDSILVETFVEPIKPRPVTGKQCFI